MHAAPDDIVYSKGDAVGGSEFHTDHTAKLKFQGIEGSGIYPPAFKLVPSMETDLGPIGCSAPSILAMRFTQRLAGHDLTVLDYVGDQQYPQGRHSFSAGRR